MNWHGAACRSNDLMPRDSDEMKEMWLPENPNLGCLGSHVAQVSSVRPSTFHHYQCHSNAFMLCTELRKQKVLRKFRINIFDSEDFHDFFLICSFAWAKIPIARAISLGCWFRRNWINGALPEWSAKVSFLQRSYQMSNCTGKTLPCQGTGILSDLHALISATEVGTDWLNPTLDHTRM